MSFPLQERVWSPFVSSLFHHSPAASSKRHSGQVGDGQFEGKVGLWLNWELVPLCDPGKLPDEVLFLGATRNLYLRVVVRCRWPNQN